MMEEGVLVYDYSDILHMHCQTCYQSHCSEQQNCAQARCLYCSVLMHSCKIDDHETICGMMLKPCLNAHYGCPIKVQRCDIAKHLNTCPANVVQCGMEWNRYPLYSREKFTLSNIYSHAENRFKQAIEHWIPFPETNPPKIKGQLDIEFALSDQRKLTSEKKKKMKIGRWKMTRRPEVARIDRSRINHLESLMSPKSSIKKSYTLSNGLAHIEPNCAQEECDCSNGRQHHTESPDIGTAVTLPSKSKIEELRVMKEKYLQDGGNSNLGGSKPEELLYNDSEKSNHRGPEPYHVGKNSWTKFKEKKDFSEEELVFSVNVQSEDFHSEQEAVLVSTKEVPNIPRRCLDHLENAQTKGLGLNIVIETIPKFQSTYPMYSIPCLVSLRRDQYCSHFKNVHDDIHGGLNYWTQHRCPLAQYGCTYIRHRLRPGSKEASVVFDHEIDNFGVRPTKLTDCERQESGNEFSIFYLPVEVIEKMMTYLDSFSINQFSKTCKAAREICRTLLQRRGIVVFDWERGYYPDGSVTWRVRKKRWFFTPAFSQVDSWCYTDEPSIGEHLKKCKFFDRVLRSKVLKLLIPEPMKVKLKSDWRASPTDG